MKRSEMIKIINDSIYEYNHTGKGWNFDSLSTYLLYKIEEAGIKPPPSKSMGPLVTWPDLHWDDE